MTHSAYATVAEVKIFAMQLAKGDDEKILEYLAPASRIIDQLSGLPDGYFCQAGTTSSERTFQGDGTRRLRIDPHKRRSIKYVGYKSLDYYAPDYEVQRDENGTCWLVTPKCEYWQDDLVAVSAVWGFDQTPPEISQATVELALLMFRQRDPALTKVQIDVNGTLIKPEDVPPRVKTICDSWSRRAPLIFA